MADINVVPYVDVMLVLVVILMVAAPFVNPGVVELPTVAKAGQQKEMPVRVVVRSDGRDFAVRRERRDRRFRRENCRPRCDSVRRAIPRRRW